MTLTVLQGSNLYTVSPTLSTCTAMDYVRLRGEEHHFSMPVKMILYSLEAAQELMVAVRDLRRTVRLVQSGWVGGWGPRYLVHKRERGPARVPRLLSEGKH